MMSEDAIFLRDYERSGMSQRAYAKSIGLSASTVCVRLKRARQQMSTSTFVPLHVSSPEHDSSVLKIRLPNGIELEIPVC